MIHTLALSLIAAAQAAAQSDEAPPDRTITRFTVNEDSTRIAVATGDHVTRVISMPDGKVLLQLAAQQDRITDLEFRRDGQRLVVACLDGKARVYALAHGAEVAALDAYSGGGSGRWTGASATYSGDGKRLLTWGHGPKATIWDLDRKKRIALLGNDTDGCIEHAVWSPDDRLVATAGASGTVRVFDGLTGAAAHRAFRPDEMVNGLAFDPKGERLVVACGHAHAVVFEFEADKLILDLSLQDADMFHDLAVCGLAFSPDGKHLLTTSFPFHEVRAWDAASGKEEWRSDFGGGNPGGIQARYSPDGARVFVNRSARTIDARTGKTLRVLPHSLKEFYSLTPDGKLVISIHEDHLLVRDAETLSPSCRLVVQADGSVALTKVQEQR